MRTFVNLTGKTFGRLKVIGIKPLQKYEKTKWICLCSCGKQSLVIHCNLLNGNTTSCGCLRKVNALKASSKHGWAGRWPNRSVEYTTHQNILARCYNPKNIGYMNYGGRGIMVCERWRGTAGFPAFLSDMGRRPSKVHSLDRIDNDGNYEPSNCRWATRKEQNLNTRQKRLENFSDEQLLSEIRRRTPEYGVTAC